MENTKIFYISIISFFCGTAGYFIMNTGIFVSVFLLVLGASLLLFVYIIKDTQKIFLICALCLIAFSFGSIRAFMRDSNVVHTLDGSIGDKVSLIGEVTNEVRLRETNKEILIRTEDGNGIRLSADLHSNVSYGDIISVKGKLQKPKNFETDTGRIFDYVSYLERQNIEYQIFFPEIELFSHDGGNKIKKVLFGIKNSFISSIGRSIPEPHASLAGGITVGADDSLGSVLENDLRRTGIIHIVVLSGYNVTIVSEFFMKIFGALPFLWKSVLGALSILLFMIMTGATATIVRASIMAGLLIFARVTGRTSDMIRLLFFAGFIMVLINPFVLLYDPSFQLSFIATFGLIFGTPYVEKLFKNSKRFISLKELAVSTISTQIFVLPLILYMTGQVSIVALIVNLLVLPVIPFAMLLGLVVGFVGFISTALAFPFGFVEYGALEYVFRVVDFFADLSFASISIPNFSIWWMFGMYGVYLAVFLFLNRK